MSERISKYILTGEALFLVIPVTMLFLFWAPDEILQPWIPALYWSKAVALLTGIPLMAGWWLMGSFWLRGSIALRKVHAVVWWAAVVGAFCSVASGVLWWLANGERLPGNFGVAAFGTPLLIPFMHLIAECRRETSNDRVESDV